METMAMLDKDKKPAQIRIARLGTVMTCAEGPPSQTQHFLSTIEIEAGKYPSKYRICCNSLVYQRRGETEKDFRIGILEDMFRQENHHWSIAYQTFVSDQQVLPAKNVSLF